mgnify:CR=1 FL=1
MKIHQFTKLIILCVIVLLSIPSFSQAPKLDWLVTQEITPRDDIWEIAQHKNSVYKAGGFTGTLLLNPARTDTAISSVSGSAGSGFIVKYDTNGNYNKTILLNAQASINNSNPGINIRSLLVLSNGNIVISGNYSGEIIVNDTLRTIGIDSDKSISSYLMSFDSNLNYLWGNSVTNLARHSLGYILSLDISEGANFSVFASFYPVYPFTDSGFHYGNNPVAVLNNGNDVILKVDGNTGAFSNSYTEFNTDNLGNHCNDESGNIYYTLGGTVYKKNSLFQSKWNKLLTTDNLNTDEGSLIYDKGAVYLSCFTYFDFDGTPLTNKSHILAKLETSNGNVIWKKIITEPSRASQSAGRILAKDGELVLTGSFRETLFINSDSLVSTGSWDAFILKFDTSGSLTFKSTLAGPSIETKYLSNEQGHHLYLSLQAKTTTNFVVDGSSPSFVSRSFTSGFAKYTLSPSAPVTPPVVNLGNDTTICSGTSLVLSSGLDSSYRHQWNTGDTTPNITATAAGQYIVQVVNGSGTVITADTLLLTIENLTLNLGNDTSFSTSYTLTVSLTPGNILWSTGSTSSSITVFTSGVYWVTFTSPLGCSYTDTIVLQKIIPPPVINLGNDTTICSRTSLILFSRLSLSHRNLWSNGDTMPSISVTTSGQYWVHILDTSGTVISTDTIHVTVENLLLFLGNDTSFVDSIILSIPIIGGSLVWSSGQTSLSLTVKNSGTYWVTFTSPNGCVYSDTIILQKRTTGIHESKMDKLVIYPNPATHFITIKGLDNKQNTVFRIYHSSGKLVQSGKLEQETIDVSQLKSGSYFIQLANTHGISTHSFIKN